VFHRYRPAVAGESGSPQPLALSRLGRVWRLVATALAAGAIVYGTVTGAEKMFPAGPMTQYAFYVAPDGRVDSIQVFADTTTGTHVPVHLSPSGVGIKRADIEIQLPAIERDPSLLRSIAVAQRRLHPDQPQYVRLYVVDTVIPLRHRVPQRSRTQVLVTWTVT
jgi:hypothetical protein